MKVIILESNNKERVTALIVNLLLLFLFHTYDLV